MWDYLSQKLNLYHESIYMYNLLDHAKEILVSNRFILKILIFKNFKVLIESYLKINFYFYFLTSFKSQMSKDTYEHFF